MLRLLPACVLLACLPATALPGGADKDKKGPPLLKVGIIGCDTSHVTAFTQIFHDPKAAGELANIRVVAAYPGGSPDIPSSAKRIDGFVRALRDTHGVTIDDSIEEMVKHVDVVLLESVDGRPHLKQLLPVLKARKPVFVDKPVAGSLAEALLIFKLAAEHKVPIFSSSSLRFAPGIIGMRKGHPKVGEVLGCDAWGPCELEKSHPDLYWYGVHGVETLFTIMGTGCEKVSRTQTKDFEFVVGTWKDGRVGTFRGIRKGKSGYGATVFGTKGIEPAGQYAGYKPLVSEIAKFFRGGPPPVSAAETVEMFAFMEAADESKRRGGAPVALRDVLDKAEKEGQKIAAGLK